MFQYDGVGSSFSCRLHVCIRQSSRLHSLDSSAVQFVGFPPRASKVEGSSLAIRFSRLTNLIKDPDSQPQEDSQSHN